MNKTPTIQLFRPYSLEKGKDYLYRERGIDPERKKPLIVKFISYDPCPAIVIISDPSGCKIRCPRADLFETEANNFQDTPLLLSSMSGGKAIRLEGGENQF